MASALYSLVVQELRKYNYEPFYFYQKIMLTRLCSVNKWKRKVELEKLRRKWEDIIKMGKLKGKEA
jgi:hypothetical protein